LTVATQFVPRKAPRENRKPALTPRSPEWPFTIKLERIEPPDARRKAPRILDSHGKAPKQYGSGDD